MCDVPDAGLLEQFAQGGSETAFAALVARHINLVYSTALRHTANPHHAEEITQAVFVILARKARSLPRRTVLSGWLYHTTRLTAANFQRAEWRRVRREQEAYMQSTIEEHPMDTAWRELSPLLDEAMARLRPADRDALVLRFFENKSLREVGDTLGLQERAAQKRVLRGLEKLRTFFARRGVALTSTIIAGAVSANSVQAAPAALTQSITAVAVAQGATVSGSTLTLIKGALKLMAWSKMKTAAVAGVAAILAIGTTTVVVKQFISPPVENYFAHFETMNLEKAPPVLILRPSRYARQGDYIITTKMDLHDFGKVMRRGCSLASIFASAYDFGQERIVLPADAPKGQFDLLLTVPDHPAEALRQAIKKQLGLAGHPETRDTDVLVLKVSNPTTSGLKVNTQHTSYTINSRQGGLTLVNFKMSDVAYSLAAGYFNLPVIDETGLTESYDLDLHWNGKLKWNDQKQDIQRALKEQLGLELVPDRRPIELLIVEKAP